MRPSPALRSALAAGASSLTVKPLGAAFPYVWLRDACPCARCVHPATRQKLLRTSDVPPDIAPVPGGVRLAADALHVRWPGHESAYPIKFLERHASPAALKRFHREVEPVLWDQASIAGVRDLYLPYADLDAPEGMERALRQLLAYGLLFVTGVPSGETDGATCELRALARRFGEIRTTFYGETWDVRNVKDSRNIAYTNLDLGIHMDLLYFQHPPRFQILHCLRNRVAGGTSLFVDARAAAETLRAEDPAAFDILAATPVAFHYINDGHHLHCAHPTIELAAGAGTEADAAPIAHINYSPPFQAPLPRGTPRAFYPALARFAGLLARPAGTLAYTLREGDAVLFDNRRVLHARTAFSETAGARGGEGETNRWLKGCYLEADALLDRLRVLRSR